MREIRLSGSEGGGTLIGSPYPYHPKLGHYRPRSVRGYGWCRVDGCGWRAGTSVRPPNCACPLSGRGRRERGDRFRSRRTLGQRGAVLAILRAGANAPAKPYPVLPRHATGCRARPKTNRWRHGEAFAPSFTLALTAVAVVVTHQLTAIATS
jgi:hypothetical protein